MQIKVCGLKNKENIQALADLPINMLGLIFYPKSPRFIKKGTLSGDDFAGIDQELVGVFVNEKIPLILQQVSEFGLAYAQLHGDESPEYCRSLKEVWPSLKLMKAFSIDEDFDFQTTHAYTDSCELFLFDTKTKDRGGSGQKFDWSVLDNYQGLTPFMLSGGIGPDDVAAVRALQHPQLRGLDINSKFETAPGEKNVAKVKAFLEAFYN